MGFICGNRLSRLGEQQSERAEGSAGGEREANGRQEVSLYIGKRKRRGRKGR